MKNSPIDSTVSRTRPDDKMCYVMLCCAMLCSDGVKTIKGKGLNGLIEEEQNHGTFCCSRDIDSSEKNTRSVYGGSREQ